MGCFRNHRRCKSLSSLRLAETARDSKGLVVRDQSDWAVEDYGDQMALYP